MSAALLAGCVAISFLAAALLLRWACAECGTLPLTEAYEHNEEQGPAGFWPSVGQRAHTQTGNSGPETAMQLFQQGCPCRLALLAVFGPAMGLSRGEAFETQLGLARAMHLQGMCGAAVGALTLLKAQAERERAAGEAVERKPEREPSAVFVHDFAEHWGSLYCRNVLGCDLETPEGKAKAQAGHLVEALCPGVVRDAAALAVRLSGNGHWIRPEHRTLHKDVGLQMAQGSEAPGFAVTDASFPRANVAGI